MTGVEAVIGGAFISATIKTVVDTGRCYFSEKYKEHKDIQEMLDSLNASLPRILSVVEMAERMHVIQDASLAAWLRQLKDVAYEAEDIMDDFEAKRIWESLKNKGKVSEIASSSVRSVKSLFLSDNDEKKLKYLVKKIQTIFDGVGDLINVMTLRYNDACEGSSSTSIRETSYFLPNNKKIFGRDKDIDLLLDMIIGYRENQSKFAYQEMESQLDLVPERENQPEIFGNHGTPMGSFVNFLKSMGNIIPSPLKTGINAIYSTMKKESQRTHRTPATLYSRYSPATAARVIHRHGTSIPGQPSSSVSSIGHYTASTYSHSTAVPVPDSINYQHSSYRQFNHSTGLAFLSQTHSSSPGFELSNYYSSIDYSSIDYSSIDIMPASLHSNDIKFSFCIGKRNLDVLPIVGIGGVGKTTIAQALYNHPRVKEYFELQGWVYVMDSTDYKRLLNDIVLSFDVGISKSMKSISSLNEGHNRLIRAIEHKKFLLIFDDVREGIDLTWERLLPVLAEGAFGSLVIVTTQWKSVASTIGTLPPVFLVVLEWHHFLALFEYHAFGYFKYRDVHGNQNFSLSQDEQARLKPIGEKIAKKLHCLPLAAETVGNLLSNNLEKNYWEDILRSDWWSPQIVANNVVPSLGVSFLNLDPDLLQCFIYCSLFPKNYVFDKDRLVQMWIADGVIHPKKIEQFRLERDEIKLEDIGISRFGKLVGMFFFQTTIWENRYVMHDLIRELAIAISTEELYINSKDLKHTRSVPSFPRHLAIDSDVDANFYVDHIQWSEKNVKRLRTIMFFGYCKLSMNKGIHNILYELTGLRLLDLSYIRINQNPLPEKIFGRISHIRFLDLSFSGITSIPNSLCQLVHLQVLNIRGCWFSELPPEMNQLINLRHLYASPQTISLIFGIGKLTNLQELEKFSVRKKKGFTISELKDMDFLNGQFTIRFEYVPSKEEAISAKLEKKKYLTSLIFVMALAYPCETIEHHQEVLEELKPHKNITELTIKHLLSVSFPYWLMEIHQMNNLHCIQLIECFQIETLPPLGSLPSLEVLNLSDIKSITCIGRELYGTSDVIFPSLKELTFSSLWKLEYWSDPGERQLFPCLQKLKITNCSKLSEVPFQCLNSSMIDLHLSACDKVIQNVGKYFPAMTSLTQLYLQAHGCMKMNHFCSNCPELRALTLGRIIIDHLEGQISSLVNLRKLSLPIYWEREPPNRKQSQGDSQAQNIQNLPSLACIDVQRCYGIPKFLLRVGMFPSVRTLWIDYCERVEFSTEEDSWFHRLPSLEDLKLSDCKYFRCLPSSLSTLSFLKKFTLKGCPQIHSLPQGRLPQSLKELYISECSAELMKGCKPHMGEEWSKISHIAYIRVGKQTVQYSDDMPPIIWLAVLFIFRFVTKHYSSINGQKSSVRCI